MAITAQMVKELRESTGAGMMDCKKALQEAEGSMEKAVDILREKGLSKAAKKADRVAAEGLVTVEINADHTAAAIVEVNSETDFVAKNEDFITLANNLADMAIEEGTNFAKEKSANLINEVIQKVGEKIMLGEIKEIEGSILGEYVHNNKSAVIVSLKGGDKETAKDIAMHIAAMKPVYTKIEDITEEDRNKVLEVFEKEVESTDKPEEIKKKMLEGKISTYFKEQTLLEQPFIKNPDLKIGQLLTNKNAELLGYICESIG